MMMGDLKKILGSAYDLYSPRERVLYASLILRWGPPSKLQYTGIPPKTLIKDIFLRQGRKTYEQAINTKCVVKVEGNTILAIGDGWKAWINMPTPGKFIIRHRCDVLKKRIKYGLICPHIMAVFLNMNETDLMRFVRYLINNNNEVEWVLQE